MFLLSCYLTGNPSSQHIVGTGGTALKDIQKYKDALQRVVNVCPRRRHVADCEHACMYADCNVTRLKIRSLHT